ncbi:hypothetical protein CLU96_1847 [Chryseobacterium sp. 52]|uniref:hypothetical protein n=1 Tax=Chryseobacterium sp. 52 TaxID=2035213 RepID=UPI000C1910B1|nr:hypothetical protein [Chryseobacterium sp. 52]PIF44851.1 hypothetical protein CLU96_1847 [Chryseobacterium sp. 52]
MNFKIDLKRDSKIIFGLFLIIFTLNSCEAFLQYSGNVYNDKNEPIQEAKISLIIEKRDTVKSMAEKFDTISIAARKDLRKKGVKDNFIYTSRGLAEPVPLHTDKNGYFDTRSILVSCLFKCPNVKILVQKDKVIKAFSIEELKKVEIKNDSLQHDFFKKNSSTKLSIFL